MKQMLANIVLSGAGAGVLVLVIARLLPDDKVKAFGRKIGVLSNAYLSSRLGAAFWNPIKMNIEHSVGQLWGGIVEGWNGVDSSKEVANVSNVDQKTGGVSDGPKASS